MTMYFISQPMRGLSDDEIKATQDELFATIQSADPDATLINPYAPEVYKQMHMGEMFKKPEVFALGSAITQMAFADVVVFARGWENFPGCRIEQKVATYYDMELRYA